MSANEAVRWHRASIAASQQEGPHLTLDRIKRRLIADGWRV